MSRSRLSRCATDGEDLRGDLVQRVEQEVHRPVRGVVGEPGAALDRDPLGDPAGGGQLGARLQRPLRDQREHHPLDRVAVQAPPGGDPADRRADPEPFPDPVQRPRPAEAPRVQHLDLTAACAAVDRLLRVRNREIEDTSRASASRSTLSARPKLWITFADRVPADRVPLVVRQLQIAHHRAVPVAPPRLPQEHAYTVTTSPQLMSSDTPQVVCLHVFVVRATSRASYQHDRAALPPKMPTNCGSPA